MPELPEVETVRRVLAPHVVGKRLLRAELLHEQVIAHPAPGDFAKRLPNHRIAGLSRRGKFLIFELEGGSRMLLHLRMTGALLLLPANAPLEKHCHFCLHLEGDQQLCFIDPRRFGRLWYFEKDEADTLSGISRLGIEPFDSRLTGEYLASQLGKSKRAIKTCLLDQHIIAGIGNIYADETLFAIGLSPALPACALSTAQWEMLSKQIPQTLRFAIEKNAISFSDYVAGQGKDYRNTPFLSVYNHQGKPCPRCGGPFSRTVVGGRGTVYCPCCQKAKGGKP